MRHSEEKLTNALLEIYRRVYAVSTPVGDFDKLLEEANTDEFGRKVIPFNDYECEDKVMEKIVDEVLKEYKIKDYNAKRIKTTFWLGCSPKSKKDKHE